MKNIFDRVMGIGLSVVIILCGISIFSWYMDGWNDMTIVYIVVSIYSSFLLVCYVRKITLIERQWNEGREKNV